MTVSAYVCLSNVHFLLSSDCQYDQCLESATLDFSVKGQPTICCILPVYKQIEQDLKAEARKLAISQPTISMAFDRGSQKATKYINKALISDFTLLGASMSSTIYSSVPSNKYMYSSSSFTSHGIL
jgi:hypothetical protein